MHMSVMDAAYNVGADYKDGGAAGLARRCGENPNHFSASLSQTGTAKLGLQTAVKMTVLSGDLRILQAYADACGQMVVPLPEALDIGTDDCIQRLGDAAAEFGKVAAETCSALADGKVSANELARFRRLRGSLANALIQLDVALAAKHEAGLPAHAIDGGDA